ncbi:MAG TPA: hypothetical protein VGB77_12325 [Abditibacteriaceae bacterium]
MKRWLLAKWGVLFGLTVVGLIMAGCNGASSGSGNQRLVFDFANGPQNWVGGFADYPANNSEIFELTTDYRSLPAPLDNSKSALFISGINRSDDLWMFYKRRVTGLRPNSLYRVQFEVQFATEAAKGCFGVGGAPGESVFVKAGASTVEPMAVVDNAGDYRFNVDKGNQANGGAAALVLGNVANTRDCALPAQWELKTLNSPDTLSVRTDANGALWLFFGTDSGFESLTRLYYTRFSATFTL